MLQFKPPHPGSFIKRIYIRPHRSRSIEIASKLKISPSTLSRLVNGKLRVSPMLALKLSKVFGRSPESWMAMQNNFDLWKAKSCVDLSRYKRIKFELRS